MMIPSAVIAKKRDGRSLADEEIRGFVAGFTSGVIPDYQMSALAMAVCCRGMTDDETFALTTALLESGTTLPRNSSGLPRVDKHSTGGIGDKVSLILAPLLACCGLHVPMISGRGLGATGGTLDKLESIPGFRTQLSEQEIESIVADVGCVIAGATESLVPADRKLYALRDVTGTVPSIPLITASIMSKKLAEGLDALVLDVKHGSGAFMKDKEDARALAKLMIAIGNRCGVHTTALLTDMQQPLGRMIGNAVEVNESIDALEGNGPADLMELTLRLGVELLVATSTVESPDDGRRQLESHVDSGRARERFGQMVAAQGGDIDAPRPVVPRCAVVSREEGFVVDIDAEALGLALIQLGGGRRRQRDAIDHSVGLEMLVRIGDRVERNQELLRVFAPAENAPALEQSIHEAIRIGPELSPVRPLITAI